ncbi:MAG TPA: N-acetylmuramoyl-L-alanine amidase [Thermoleophilaceae bacterium]|nr:N-acetylmuramoyl-L-alanine amidase [Thermoleophilaceae bacterium]
MLATDFELTPGSLHAAGADRPVVSAPVRAPRRFDLVGLRWRSGGPTPVVRLRVRRDGGDWSRWFRLAPGDSGPRASDPLWTGGSDVVQYQLSRPVAGLKLRFVKASGSPAIRAAAADRHGVISRGKWTGHGGCRPRVKPEYGTVDVAFIHHTVNANTYSKSDVPSMILAICRYHRDSNGWNDIGYNFVVDRFGRVWEGRQGGIDQAVIGAHTLGVNSYSTGIANLGTFDTSGQTGPALDAMEDLIRWKLPLHGAHPSGHVTLLSGEFGSGRPIGLRRISGHRDAYATECPGAALYAQIPDLRERMANLDPAPPETRAAIALDRPPEQLGAGRRLHVTGTIAPAARYVMAVVDRRSGDRWVPYGRAVIGTGDAGAFDQKLELERGARYRVYVRYGGSSKLGYARSAGFQVRVAD